MATGSLSVSGYVDVRSQASPATRQENCDCGRRGGLDRNAGEMRRSLERILSVLKVCKGLNGEGVGEGALNANSGARVPDMQSGA